MKHLKYFVLSLCALFSVTLNAQEIVVGDMNDDGNLSVADVTSLVSTISGATPMRKISGMFEDNESIVGTWTSLSGAVSFGEDGTIAYPGASTYKYLPMQSNIVLFDALENVVGELKLVWRTEEYIVLRKEGTATYIKYYKGSPVSGISLSQTSIQGVIGNTYQLTAEITPNDVAIPALSWTTSDETIATVSPTGLVTVVAGGTVTITVSATDGSGVSASCTIDTPKPVTSIELNATSLSLDVEDTYTLLATVIPADAFNPAVKWSSSDPDIVYVNKSGRLVALDYGTATITCSSTDGSGVTAACVVEVKELSNWVAPSASEFKSENLVSGQSYCIMNVESGKFMNGMKTKFSWSTTCGLSDDVALFTLTQTGSGWTMMGTNNKYVFRSGPEECHDDMASQGHNYFEFTKLANGNYTIASASSDADYAGTGFWGYQPDAEFPSHMYANSTAENAFIEWVFVPELYSLKKSIYDWVTLYEPQRTDIDFSEAKLTYCKSDVTLDELETALANLRNLLFPGGYVNGHEYVDLDLPSGTLWATCNIGADKPEDYGLYFAWGETIGYTSNTSDGRQFDWANYSLCNGSSSKMTKYSTSTSYWDSSLGTSPDGKTELDLEDDAAHVNWGGDWRMPSRAQLQELVNSSYTTTTWTSLNGVYGRLITSKLNGNTLFLPAAGCRYSSSFYDAGSYGYYWSRSLVASSSSGAWDLSFNSSYVRADYYLDRYYGLSVRPVCSASE